MNGDRHLWLFPWKDPPGLAVSKGLDLLKACQIALQKDSLEYYVLCTIQTQKNVLII